MTDTSSGPAPAPAHDGPHYRSNPFGAPVIVAASRGARPHDSRSHADIEAGDAGDAPPSFDPDCPFCPGNEARTPPEVDADRSGGSTRDAPGWAVRVVPNKYPALTPPEPAATASGIAPAAGTDLLSAAPAPGLHEVAIHSPDHAATLARIEPVALTRTLAMWRRRLAAHRDAGWPASTLVINEGREAGASLAHPHAQIFATHEVPPALAAELDRQRRYMDVHGAALLGAVVAAERDSERVVDTEGDLVAWVPFWASAPYEVWIAPAAQDGDGRFASSADIARLADMLPRLARRLRKAAGDPAFNVVLRDLPAGAEGTTWWHLRIIPRGAIAAGFELATGVQIVPMRPETAAAELRAAPA